LSIEFAALSFTSPRNVQFRFRLEGLETEWVEAGGRRIADYSHLPPGTYRFQASASDQAGNWSDPGATIEFELPPLWWQTGWFRALMLGALLATVAGVARYAEMRKMKSQVERAEQERAVEHERARIAKDIHDDLGASLTEITMLSELAQTGDVSQQEFQTDMRRIAARTRHLTQSLDATVWAVNPRNDSLESLVSYTCGHAEDFLRSAGIRCRLEVPPELRKQDVAAPVRHNVFLIVKEALHNVVKHSEATEVALRIMGNPGVLILELEDNGKGFGQEADGAGPGERAPRRWGNGLANMRKRADAIGAKFELRSEPGRGTHLTLHLRLHTERDGTKSTSHRAASLI
jgi:signal transduction histidine kinase